ncbi:hypothetical protein [Tannerella sp.]|uniref:hypothetical protein n=1 Tax=Tannerella sp. TaxID=2382127 RepID=UPI003FA1AC50
MAFVHGPRAVSRRSSERGERKSGCPSEASYLIFRPASVAKACEAHEALTFGLLLGQAKSNGKEILRFALNDKGRGITNYKLRTLINSGFQPSTEGVAFLPNAPLRSTLG